MGATPGAWGRIDSGPTGGAACPHAEQAPGATTRRGQRRSVPPAGRGGAGLCHLPARPGRPGGQLEREAERIKGYTAEEILGQEFTRFYEPHDVAAGVPARILARATAEGRYQGRGWRGPQGRRPLLRPGDGHRPVRFLRAAQRVHQDHPGRDRRAGGRARPPRPRVPAGRGAGRGQAGKLRVVARQRPGDLEPGAVPDPRLDPEAYCGTLDGLLRLVHPDDRAEAAATLRLAAAGASLVPHAGAGPAADRRAPGPVQLGRGHPRRAGTAVAGARRLPGRHQLAPAGGAAHRGPGPGRAVPPAADRAAAEPVPARPGTGAAHRYRPGHERGPARGRLLRRAAAGRRDGRPPDR